MILPKSGQLASVLFEAILSLSSQYPTWGDFKMHLAAL